MKNYIIFTIAGILDNPKMTIFIGAVIITIVASVYSSVRGKEEAAKGVAKRNIANILKALLPEGEEYAWVYGNHSQAVSTRTRHHYYYALAVQPEQLYVVPLRIAGDTIGADEYFVIRKENIGKITYLENFIELYDKNEDSIFKCSIMARYNRFGVEDPISIYQDEEKAEFMEVLKVWEGTVNQK